MKKQNYCMMILGTLLFCMFLLGHPVKANASVRQTGQTQNSVTITWDGDTKALNYKIYITEDYSKDPVLLTILNKTQKNYTINNLKAGTEYYVRVKYDYNSSSGSTPEYSEGSVYIKTTPGKVTGLKQDKWYYFALSFYAIWDKQNGVDGYEYNVWDNKGNKKSSGTVSYPSFSVSKISNTVIYTGQVRAYSTINGQKIYGEWSEKAYFFTQPRIKSAKVSNNTLTVKWSKVGGATGYEVYISTKPQTGYKKVKTVGKKKSSAKIKKFNKKKISGKKKYYVYIVTLKKVGNITNRSGRLYYWNTKNKVFGYFN